MIHATRELHPPSKSRYIERPTSTWKWRQGGKQNKIGRKEGRGVRCKETCVLDVRIVGVVPNVTVEAVPNAEPTCHPHKSP